MLVLCIADVVLVMMDSLPINDSMADPAPNMWLSLERRYYGNHWIEMLGMIGLWMVGMWALSMVTLNHGSCRTKAPLDAEHFAGGGGRAMG